MERERWLDCCCAFCRSVPFCPLPFPFHFITITSCSYLQNSLEKAALKWPTCDHKKENPWTCQREKESIWRYLCPAHAPKIYLQMGYYLDRMTSWILPFFRQSLTESRSLKYYALRGGIEKWFNYLSQCGNQFESISKWQENQSDLFWGLRGEFKVTKSYVTKSRDLRGSKHGRIF
jgi:hypothetical protein